MNDIDNKNNKHQTRQKKSGKGKKIVYQNLGKQ